MITVGARIFGLGIIALALVCLAFGNFDFGQSVPKEFPPAPCWPTPSPCSC